LYIFKPSLKWAPHPGSKGMEIMGKCMATILILAVTVASKLRLKIV